MNDLSSEHIDLRALLGNLPDLAYRCSRESLQAGLEDHGSFEVQYRIVTRDEETKWVWERGIAVGSEKHCQYFVGFITDGSPLLPIETQLKNQQDKMARLGRLGILGEITAGIAHEINQPLAAISIYAQSCLRFMNPDKPNLEMLQEALGKLSGQTQRAGSIVERIRELARRHGSEI